jgi:hypothetical protein
MNCQTWFVEVKRKKVHFDHQLLPQFGFDLVSLTIQLLKPFIIDHQVVSIGGFNFFIYNLVSRSENDYYFFIHTSDLGDSYGHTFITTSFIF